VTNITLITLLDLTLWELRQRQVKPVTTPANPTNQFRSTQ